MQCENHCNKSVPFLRSMGDVGMVGKAQEALLAGQYEALGAIFDQIELEVRGINLSLSL